MQAVIIYDLNALPLDMTKEEMMEIFSTTGAIYWNSKSGARYVPEVVIVNKEVEFQCDDSE